ncbi:hypothetical protein D915_006850 [Fasciola hepatica]|uniref:Uncharacterized protein n=1 Tax=Fasciola hepatica TaxID=6192 RepID=A0A4E0R5Y2_FASHE|nr:hypothetical protein D915_006850 [Fasciola hepatica]
MNGFEASSDAQPDHAQMDRSETVRTVEECQAMTDLDVFDDASTETMISRQPHLTDTELKFVGTSKPTQNPKVYLPMILLDSREPSCRFSEYHIDGAKRIHFAQDQSVGNSRRPYATRTVLGRALLRPTPKHATKMKYTNFLPTEATLCSKISGMFVLEFEEEHRDNSALSLEDNAATKIVTDSATVVEVRCHFHLPWGRDRRDLSNISLLSQKQMRHIMKKAGWAGARGYGENLHGTDTTERLVQVMRNFSDGRG